MQEEKKLLSRQKDRASFLLSTPMIVWTMLFVGATIA